MFNKRLNLGSACADCGQAAQISSSFCWRPQNPCPALLPVTPSQFGRRWGCSKTNEAPAAKTCRQRERNRGPEVHGNEDGLFILSGWITGSGVPQASSFSCSLIGPGATAPLWRCCSPPNRKWWSYGRIFQPCAPRVAFRLQFAVQFTSQQGVRGRDNLSWVGELSPFLLSWTKLMIFSYRRVDS
jgi:hypothetical protein